MDSSQTFTGYWWVPSAPDQQWFGTLKWKPSGSPRLKLHYKSAESATAPPETTECFHGQDSSGTTISVLRAGSSGTYFRGFLSRRKYSAGHILKGAHVSSLKDLRITGMRLWIQHFAGWMGEEGFKKPETFKDSFNIQYTRPEDREFQISPGISIKLCHSSVSDGKARERTIKYDVYISVEKKRPFTFASAVHWMRAFCNLIHFSCLRTIHLTKVTFQHSDHTFQLGDKSYPKEFELLSAMCSSPVDKDLDFDDYIFRFESVKDRFATFCSDWFKFYIKQHEAIGCYTSTVYSSLHDEIKLISLTEALEAFHEHRYHPKPYYPFAKRMRELCEKYRSRVEPVVGDIDIFINRVRDTRNYYTHHSKSIRAEGNVLSGAKLTMMGFHLQFLFRLCVLGEFGLEADPHSMLKRWVPYRITEYY